MSRREGRVEAASVDVKVFARDDLEAFLGLSRAVYGSSSPAADADHIRWKHLSSVPGESTYVRLVADESTVGRALLMPRVMEMPSGQFRAAFVADVVIDPEFRSPPSNFANLTLAAGNLPEFDLVYHSSSRGRTDLLYRKFFRFPTPFSLRAYSFPTRLSGVVKKISGLTVPAVDWLLLPLHWLLELLAAGLTRAAGMSVKEQLPDETRLSLVVAKVVRQQGPTFSRTAAFLKWRMIDAPLWAGAVHCLERGNRLLGYVATRRVEMKGLSFLVVVDFLLDPDLSLLQRLAVRAWLARRAARANVDCLFTMVNAHSRAASALTGFPMVPIPHGLMPHQAAIFMRARHDGSRWLETDRAIHMTLADLDF